MNSEIKIYDSNKPGPTLTIFACVHGNEPCGEKALRQFVFHPSRGRIITVIANIAALRAGKRFIDCDLNRSFTKSGTDALESQTAKILANILDESDALLDIHASSSVKSEPFVICEKHSLDIAKRMPVKKIVLGIDKYHPGSTDAYMNAKRKPAVCIECGYLGDPKAVDVAKQAIRAFLGRKTYYGQRIYRVASLYRATDEFRLQNKIEDFARIDGVIGYDGEKVVLAYGKPILFARNCKRGEEAFLTLFQTFK